MAIQYPNFVVPQGYEGKSNIGQRFAQAHDATKRIADEAAAARLMEQFGDTLYGGPPGGGMLSDLASLGGQVVSGSHAAADAATDPMLSAYFANTARVESGGNDAARNPNSSATGRYQFLEGTWNDLMKSNPELGLTPDGRTDPSQQERAIRAFTAQNAKTLRGSGLPVNPGSLYASHFLGAQGAAGVLGQDPSAPLANFVGADVMAANPHLNGMTVGDFSQWAASKGGNGAGGYSAPAATGDSNRLPPRDLMRQLLANPVTREHALALAQTGQASKPTADMQEYMFALQQGYKGDFASWQTMKKSDTNVTVNNGGSSDFYKKLDTDAGEQQATLIDAGRNARSNNMRLQQLEQHLANAPQGAQGALTQFAGSLGIPIEGLDDLQAAQALINQMVPGQRPPGSGTMSDADLALFKQSLPAIINQSGGNSRIIATTKAINDYTIAQSQIAERVANREIDPAEGRRLQAAIPNPLADFGTQSSPAAPAASAPPPGWSGDASLWPYLTPEERALWN